MDEGAAAGRAVGRREAGSLGTAPGCRPAARSVASPAPALLAPAAGPESAAPGTAADHCCNSTCYFRLRLSSHPLQHLHYRNFCFIEINIFTSLYFGAGSQSKICMDKKRVTLIYIDKHTGRLAYRCHNFKDVCISETQK